MATAALYFLGFAFLDYYYSYFGVDLHSIDPSINEVVIGGAVVLLGAVSIWIKFVLIIGLVVVIGIVIHAWAKNIKLGSPAAKSLYFTSKQTTWLSLSAYMIVMMALIAFFSPGAGKKYAKTRFEQSEDPVQLTFSQSPVDRLDSDLDKLNSAGSLRLLSQTKDVIIVFTKCDADISMRSFVIPMRTVLSVKMIPFGQEGQSQPKPNPCLDSAGKLIVRPAAHLRR